MEVEIDFTKIRCFVIRVFFQKIFTCYEFFVQPTMYLLDAIPHNDREITKIEFSLGVQIKNETKVCSVFDVGLWGL